MESLARTANRGSISTGYDIDNSLKIEADNTERMQRQYSNITSAGTPTSTKIATISFWIKRTELRPSGNHFCFNATANTTLVGFSDDRLYILGQTSGIDLKSTAVFRDTSAYYHILVAFDTTQSTASNRAKAYVNGEQVTAWDTETYGTQNNDIDLYDTNTSHYLGWEDAQSQSGYYSEFYLIDGQQLAPTEFGETDSGSGIWKPKAYDGTFGVQGYHLDFEDSSNLGLDVSGNSNNFTALYNITSADQATDTPTNNFCTLNPLWVYGNALTTGPIEGATKVSGGGWAGTKATMGVANGKWYWEYKSSVSDAIIGIQTDEGVALTGNAHNIISTCALYLAGEVWIKDSTSGRNDTDVTHTFSSSSIYGIALNMDDNQISFYQDGSLITNGGNIALDGLADKTVFPFASNYNSAIEFNLGGYTTISISSAAADANGYGTFEYAPPSGYYALCTKNLAEYG